MNKSIQSDFKIINEFGNEIYHKSMLFDKGDQLKDLTLKIPTDVISGVNLASINPFIGEKNISFRWVKPDHSVSIFLPDFLPGLQIFKPDTFIIFDILN